MHQIATFFYYVRGIERARFHTLWIHYDSKYHNFSLYDQFLVSLDHSRLTKYVHVYQESETQTTRVKGFKTVEWYRWRCCRFPVQYVEPLVMTLLGIFSKGERFVSFSKHRC